MMTSSRTPEGIPSRCPLCSAESNVGHSDPAHDALGRHDAKCPRCGARLLLCAVLLARLQALAARQPELELEEITANSPWPLGGDSLTAVEVMLELERELNISIPARDAERILTVGEAIRFYADRMCELKT
jgi:acyl carrier protein